MDGMIDRLTMSFKPYLPSLPSLVAAVADHWESVADRDTNARHFFIVTPVLLASYPSDKVPGYGATVLLALLAHCHICSHEAT